MTEDPSLANNTDATESLTYGPGYAVAHAKLPVKVTVETSSPLRRPGGSGTHQLTATISTVNPPRPLTRASSWWVEPPSHERVTAWTKEWAKFIGLTDIEELASCHAQSDVLLTLTATMLAGCHFPLGHTHDTSQDPSLNASPQQTYGINQLNGFR